MSVTFAKTNHYDYNYTKIRFETFLFVSLWKKYKNYNNWNENKVSIKTFQVNKFCFRIKTLH